MQRESAVMPLRLFESDQGNGRRSLSRPRLQVENNDLAAASKSSLESYSTETSSSMEGGSLLPYASTAQLSSEFPMPPTNFMLPHPHAPKPVHGSQPVRPAIYRSPGSLAYIATSPSTEHRDLTNTLAIAAAAGRQLGTPRGRSTIHGRTSFDLLSAPGPVPIHFALGNMQVPNTTTPSSPVSPVSPAESSFSRTNRTDSSPVILSKSVPDINSITLETRDLGDESKQRPRSQSFSDIISAIETPSTFPIGRAPKTVSTVTANLRHATNSHPSTPLPIILQTGVTEGPPLEPRSSINSGLLPAAVISTAKSSDQGQRVTSPAPSWRAIPRRKLSKPPPPPVGRKRSISRPILPMHLQTDHNSDPRDFGMPRFPASGTSSVPSSPMVEIGSPMQAALRGAKSIPNLKRMPSRSDASTPSLSQRERPSVESIGSRRFSTSSSQSSGSGSSYHAHILQDYGVDMSPDWSPNSFPNSAPPSTSNFLASNLRSPLTHTSTNSYEYDSVAPPSAFLLASSVSQNLSPSGDANSPGSPTPTSTSASTSPPSPNRAVSLRSKLSISAMRNNAAAARRRQDSSSTNGYAVSTPQIHAGRDHEETVAFEDMEFTLVKPSILRMDSSTPDNQDNGVPTTPGGIDSIVSGIGGNGSGVGSLYPRSRRASDNTSTRDQYSPVPSTITSQQHTAFGSPISPTTPSLTPPTPLLSPFNASFPTYIESQTTLAPASESPTTVSVSLSPAVQNPSNYMQLELKWITAMREIPSAESGKSRKIKKLVTDGIPASVRGVVWLYLTDNKGRRMPGVYAQLCKRGKVAASHKIWLDIQNRFPEQEHFRSASGSLMSLLQAYLCMVPDTTYNYGLSLIAGHLLLQTPEEDAFWTFVALMDRHIRGYFSPTARLLEIDSMLFQRAVVTFDKALAIRLFDELNVHATAFCGHWFTTLFACALPESHIPRVWDTVMYFSDPSFLFRLGLAILKLCKPYIMNSAQCSSSADACEFLCRPPVAIFPALADDIIASALSIKFKEDDMRKMRPKYEIQIKQRHPSRGAALRQ